MLATAPEPSIRPGADLLENPVLALRARVVTTPSQSGGELFAAEVEAGPGGSGGPAHVHLRQEERFHLRAGTLDFRVGRRRGRLRAGETLVVPPGTGHEFRAGDAGARFLAEFRPALRVDAFFEALFALARAGEVDAKGRPHPVRAARLMREFPDEFFYLPGVPVALQRALAAPVARLGGRP
jgi:mannose-6-phosphate isomerase-like protein (cupin superfamily)